MTLILTLTALAAGCIIGFVVFRFIVKGKYNSMIKEAEKDAAVIKEKKLLEVKEVFLNKKNELEKEVQQRNQKILQSENKLKQREININQRQNAITRRANEIEKTQANLEAQQQILQHKQEELERMQFQEREKLEAISGLSAEEANTKATENIKMIELPALMPADGDLTKDSSEETWVNTTVMGGINGYGISAYTKHKEACIEFVNFATSAEMLSKRAEMLGIASTRSDVASGTGEVADAIYKSLENGKIELMPSVKAVDQIWTPVQTLMGDFAKDAFRTDSEKKYSTTAEITDALQKADSDIYNAIYTLADN